MRVILRPTRLADLAAVIAEPLPFRIKALAAVLLDDDGSEQKILGVGGLCFPPSGLPIAFVQQAPEAKNYPFAFHRAGKAAIRMMEESGIREAVATCDIDNLAAGRWLARLGFRLADVQNIKGKLLWQWNRP